MDTEQKEQDCLLTIADAIAMQGISNARVKKLRALATSHASFSGYACAEMNDHLNDISDLGGVWGEAQESFCQTLKAAKHWFRRKHPERVEKMLAQATEGLRRLDSRFDDMTLDILEKRPELVYIGLVELLVKHEAKTEITRHHRRYLVVRQMQPIAA